MTAPKKTGFLTLILSVFFFMAASSAMAAQAVVKKIDITGTERIEPSTVATYMEMKVGDPLDSQTTDHALKNLFATGLFADVSVTNNDGVVQVKVVENPLINEIAFEGNEKIKSEELLNETQLRPRQVFTRTKVQSDVARLYQVYRKQGRFSVIIEPKVIRLDQNRVNLVFEITEGDVTKVKSVRFIGNEKYSDAKLRSTINTKEAAWYRFLSNDDRYDADKLAYDQELLRNFYLSQGYADFEILSAVAELSNEKDSFYVTFTVDEGERYKFGKTTIVSDIKNFDASVLNKDIKIESGDWYDADDVKNEVTHLTNALGDLQYAFVNVRPDLHKNKDTRTVDIVFNINETPRVFVERINVNGNVRTVDKVLRREMQLVEGDPFNRSKLAKSEQNIRDLDFFEKVDVKASEGSAPDKTVVDINVQEKSTGEISLGAGFSSTDGPLADFKIRERNLLGRGNDLMFSTTIAGQRTEFDASYTEPYFLDRDLSAGVDAFHVTRDYQNESSFDQKRSGGGLRLGYPLSENWRQNLRYRLEQNEITNVKDDASRFIRDQEGQRITSALSQRVTYDKRDSTLFTTSGILYWLDAEVAGLGGDADYVSGKTGASYYYPVMDQVVLNLVGEAGAIQAYGGKDVEINERYFVGGSNLRGFARSGIGPRDKTTGDALGGNLFYRGTAEVSFPVGLPKELGVEGHAFTDAGSLWSIDETGTDIQDQKSIRAAAGLGVSWRSPFGPIRVDVAVPYIKESYDEEEKFRFDFGTRF